MRPHAHDAPRARKFRQAAIAYLHYGVLYEIGAWVLVREGLFPASRGPVWMWFALGALIGGAIVWGLWAWQSPWLARGVWALNALRLPSLIEGAFFGGDLDVPAGLHIAAALIVLANMWMLARAAWDV